MQRSEKAEEIQSLKEKFQAAQVAILADYQGLSVAAISDLRRQLHKSGSTLKVVKNRLARIAAKGTPAESLVEHFKGPTALTLSEKDPVAPAKALLDFAKTNELFKVRVGLLNGKTIDSGVIKNLASLPSREELIAKMLGSLNAPATNLVSVLSQIPRQLVTVLSAIKSQKESASA